MSAGGVIVTQSTSPYFAPQAFWCIHHTLEEIFPMTIPYQVYVPSFGQWGFNLSIQAPGKIKNDSTTLSAQVIDNAREYMSHETLQKMNVKFMNEETLSGLFIFDGDTREIETDINKLDNQALIRYYEKSWDEWR